jgi:hypothetical protein
MFHRPKTEVPALSSRWVEEAAALSELHLTQPTISLAWIACEMLMKLEASARAFVEHDERYGRR